MLSNYLSAHIAIRTLRQANWHQIRLDWNGFSQTQQGHIVVDSGSLVVVQSDGFHPSLEHFYRREMIKSSTYVVTKLNESQIYYTWISAAYINSS